MTGMVDTGSNVCIGAYRIFPVLKAQPSAWDKVGTPLSASQPRFYGYSLKLSIDGKSIMTTVYRMPFQLADVDLILGTPVLSKCKIEINGNDMDLSWLPGTEHVQPHAHKPQS